jgi:creatinine amidohydrolase/Fe(II)-dependent formamide hydrolase-like protein
MIMGHGGNEREIKKFLEEIQNEKTTYQNLWNTPKAVVRGKFIAMSTYNKKSQISNNLITHLKPFEKQE